MSAGVLNSLCWTVREPVGVLASEGWREAWQHSPRYLGAFSGQRQG